jgi:hypothetical protein
VLRVLTRPPSPAAASYSCQHFSAPQLPAFRAMTPTFTSACTSTCPHTLSPSLHHTPSTATTYAHHTHTHTHTHVCTPTCENSGLCWSTLAKCAAWPPSCSSVTSAVLPLPTWCAAEGDRGRQREVCAQHGCMMLHYQGGRGRRCRLRCWWGGTPPLYQAQVNRHPTHTAACCSRDSTGMLSHPTPPSCPPTWLGVARLVKLARAGTQLPSALRQAHFWGGGGGGWCGRTEGGEDTATYRWGWSVE